MVKKIVLKDLKSDIWTTRQIIQRIGRKPMCDLLGVSKEAPRKWYARGIPALHWETLVDEYGDWLTFDLLARANKVARLPPQKRKR